MSQALAAGAFDSMITSAVSGAENRVWGRMKFYYDIKAWLPKNIVMARRAALDALAPSERDAWASAFRWSGCATAAPRPPRSSFRTNSTRLRRKHPTSECLLTFNQCTTGANSPLA